MKISENRLSPEPHDYQVSISENMPNYRFKDKPVYDADGNILRYENAKYDPFVKPLLEDVEVDENYDLTDPNTYAALITSNDSQDVTLQPAYDSFAACNAVENLVNNTPNPV